MIAAFRIASTLAASVTAMLLTSAAAAWGECVSPPLLSMVWCNNCRVEGAMATGRDEPCVRAFNPRAQSTTMVELLAARISQKAQHGVAGSNLTSFAYAPAKGFVGRDEFVVEVSYRQGKETGKVYVHFDVTVK